MLRFPKRWPTSRYDTQMSIMIVVLFVGACSFLFFGLSKQQADMKAGYDQIMTDAGFTTPRSMDEALHWIAIAENIPTMNGVWLHSHYSDDPDLLTNTDPLTTPNYGWGVASVHAGYCGRDNSQPWVVTVVFVVNGQVQETMVFDQMSPTSPNSSVYQQTLETKAVRLVATTSFDYECEDSTTSVEVIGK